MFDEYYTRMKNQPKSIILGCQGSGTNLVSRLLQATLRFSVVHDRSLIFNSAINVHQGAGDETIQAEYARIRRRIFPGKLRRRFMLKRHYRQARHFEGLPVEPPTNLIKTAVDFANYFYAYHAYTCDAAHQGIKSDDLWESIDQIENVIPNRRYVLLVRDPRDNALSITNKDFGPRNLYAAASYVEHRMRIYREEVDRVDPSKTIVIKYEDLLNQPQAEMERVAEKWNLSLCEDYRARVETMQIRSHNQQKWKKISESKMRVCEEILREMIVAYDYEEGQPTSSPVSQFNRARWAVEDVALRIPQRAYKTCRNLLFP